MYHIVGVFNGEGPPVPIPNTEVKLTCAENTCLATDWEDRSMPTQKPLERLRSKGFWFFHKVFSGSPRMRLSCAVGGKRHGEISGINPLPRRREKGFFRTFYQVGLSDGIPYRGF